jgi:hypothetical protein
MYLDFCNTFCVITFLYTDDTHVFVSCNVLEQICVFKLELMHYLLCVCVCVCACMRVVYC